MSFIARRVWPLAQTTPSKTIALPAVWAHHIHMSPIRFRPLNLNDSSTSQPTPPESSNHIKTEQASGSIIDEDNKPPTEAEIQACAYDFPWLYDGANYSARIPHYPYPKAPKIWSILGLVPQSIQYMICKSACERMLRNNTSPEYYPDQFLQGAGLAIHQLIPLLSTNVNRDALTNMMSQELYDCYETELRRQEEIHSELSIKLAAIHDGVVKDVWVHLGPKLKSGSTRGFIRWRWQTLTIALRAATDQMSSRDQVARMMMEGVQIKVDVEFDASIDYTVRSKALGTDVISDFSRRPLLVRFETPFFEPAEKMVASRKMSRPDEAPIDWNWRVSDIDYLLEQDFIERRKREDIEDEEHAQREMEQ
ncbi:hypothetical protein BX616_010148 [Lobosporangium transversale]|uniref:Uncharacterized protein n=1 Tax=Lobosporangium transversale TaxID=64571 RepID=A0A1Y2H3F7_9FUNG|nr:hypothetical protein BCR41DRAFT_391482 [Lobosporangium transversale]KAF9918134.1 hypothetical protein BX616_010148 [Lobosporangium transversale]ORZ29066.1 hypothetical protein BCR41DRAFT_391482 [Lobosporangium transversale]|eukprot:XP_021886739.1 hypothetical protein BCR41DRAFT_391482 [Lobosporangium transversale]